MKKYTIKIIKDYKESNITRITAKIETNVLSNSSINSWVALFRKAYGQETDITIKFNK